MVKFAKGAPDEFKIRVLKSQLSKLSGKDKQDYINNMWPEDRKLLKLKKK